MKKTEYGLKITIEELERLLKEVKDNMLYHDKEGSIYIKNNTITQYSVYSECVPSVWYSE